MSGLDWTAVTERLVAAREAKATATLSTVLEDDAAIGYPFGSIVPFGLTADHRVVVVVSDLAVHTRNMRKDARGSVALSEPGGDPQRGWRLTLVGRFIEDDRHKAAYAATWPVPALADFHAFVLEPHTARLIVGFGAMGWITAP